MRVLARPLLLVRRPGQAFLRHWPTALGGDVEGIHQARVATRRLREALPLLEARGQVQEVRRVRRALRYLTRALGPSRELDVSRLLLVDISRRVPAYRVATAATDRMLAAERARAEHALRHVGGTVAVAVLVARIRELAKRQEKPEATAACARRAAARLTARARALQKAVVAAGRVYAAGPLHAVRISLKKFRYSFEQAAHLSRGQHGASLRRLKALQEILGDMHDLQVLAAHVRDAGAVVSAKQRPGVQALATHLDDRIRSLHGRYVVERTALVPVLARAMRLGQSLAAVRASDAPPQHGRARQARRSRGGVR